MSIGVTAKEDQGMNDREEMALTGISDPPSKSILRDSIDRLDISADAKALLNDILDMTVQAGGQVLAVGRQILAFVFDLVQRFPNTAFGVIVALVISSLIAAIPLIGALLAPLLTPLLVAFGLAAGAVADLKQAGIRSRISVLEDYYRAQTGSS